jgi:hypothetical protein
MNNENEYMKEERARQWRVVKKMIPVYVILIIGLALWYHPPKWLRFQNTEDIKKEIQNDYNILQSNGMVGMFVIDYYNEKDSLVYQLYSHNDTTYRFVILNNNQIPMHTKTDFSFLGIGERRGNPGDTIYLLKHNLQKVMYILPPLGHPIIENIR